MAVLTFAEDSLKFKLYAVNIMLHCINEQPLSDDVDFENSMEGQLAASVLEETKKSVLGEEWDFNTDEGYALSPDADGYIHVPYNMLDISVAGSSIVIRSGALYDKSLQSRKFTAPVLCDIVWDFAFNDLTHPLRQYITLRAARTFGRRQIGDMDEFRNASEDETKALLSARNSDSRTAQYNMLTSTYGSDTLNRRG